MHRNTFFFFLEALHGPDVFIWHGLYGFYFIWKVFLFVFKDFSEAAWSTKVIVLFGVTGDHS